MSDTNLDALDCQNVQDDNSHPRHEYTAEDEAKMYDAWCAREAAALVNDLPALRPVTATVAGLNREAYSESQWAQIEAAMQA